MNKKSRALRWASLLVVLGVLVLIPRAPGIYWYRQGDNPVRRGRVLAARLGCLNCHGPRDAAEIANPGTPTESIPSFWRGSLMMFVHERDQVKNWIRYGRSHAPGSGPTAPRPAPGKPKPVFRMGAYGDRLRASQVEDLATFAVAADGFEVPTEGDVAAGYQLSRKMGCESCHGVAGSGGEPNPRGFTGFIPGWLGADFPHLAADRREFGEWVLEGRSHAFRDDARASWFLDRANVSMPAFRSALKASDVDALWTYVGWLRSRYGPRNP